MDRHAPLVHEWPGPVPPATASRVAPASPPTITGVQSPFRESARWSIDVPPDGRPALPSDPSRLLSGSGIIGRSALARIARSACTVQSSPSTPGASFPQVRCARFSIRLSNSRSVRDSLRSCRHLRIVPGPGHVGHRHSWGANADLDVRQSRLPDRLRALLPRRPQQRRELRPRFSNRPELHTRRSTD